MGPQIFEKRALFKACKGGAEAQLALLAILEVYCVKERRAGLTEFADVLKVLWERSIVDEEQIEAWMQNERSVQEFSPRLFLPGRRGNYSKGVPLIHGVVAGG